MLRFDSNAMYTTFVHDGPYGLTYGPFTHHHQHKKPLLHRACLCHRSQGFIYPSPGTQFSSSFTYLQGKNETFQGYGLVVSLIFKFLCRHNFIFIKNCKIFSTLSKPKFKKRIEHFVVSNIIKLWSKSLKSIKLCLIPSTLNLGSKQGVPPLETISM